MFTPSNDWKGRAQLVIGLTSIIVGVASWTYTTRALGGFGFGDIVPWNSTISTFLLPISIPLLIGGVGLSTYYVAMRRTWRARNRIESALDELEALVGLKNRLGDSSSDPGPSAAISTTKNRQKGLGSGMLAFALAEAIILLVLYGGLVREYASNLNMQNWVRANFAPANYLLSYNAVLALTGILGVLVFQLLPRKIRSKEIRDRVQARSID